jgi:hypothetical protein
VLGCASGQWSVEEGSRASFGRSRSRYRAFTVAGSADKKRSLIEHENEDDNEHD